MKSNKIKVLLLICFKINLKLIKLIIFLIFLISNILIVSAVNCGGNITCNCGDTVIENYILKNDLICNSNALYINSDNVILDCNNNMIIGNISNSINALTVNGRVNINIQNCNIKQFKNAISLKSRHYNIGIGFGTIITREAFTNNIKILNNTLEDNSIGIITSKSLNTKIFNNKLLNNLKYGIYLNGKFNNVYNNIFSENKEYGLYLNGDSSSTWSNIFYNTGIFYTKTSKNKFCKNNISNLYYANAKGPKCDCILAFNNLNIDSEVKLCKKKYKLSQGLNLRSNGKLNCNGAIIEGENISVGIKVAGSTKTQISNCNILNYTNGVSYYDESRKTFRYNSYASFNNRIFNSSITKVDYGITMNNPEYVIESKVEFIRNNTIIARKYNIYNPIISRVDARYNYWGSNNLSEIKAKFLKVEIVDYMPFIIKNKTININRYRKNFDLEIRNEDIFFEFNVSKNDNLNINKNIDLIEFKIYKYGDINISSLDILNSSNNINIKIIETSYDIITKIKTYNYSLNIFEITGRINNKFTNTDNIKYKILKVNWDLKNNHEYNIIITLNNETFENYKSNNYAKKGLKKKKSYYIERLDYLEVLKETLNFYIIDRFNNFDTYYETRDLNDADFKIIINNQINTYPLLKKSYEGSINSYYSNDENLQIIEINGIDIEGKISALKEFINNKEIYLNTNIFFEINSSNLEAKSVFDYMHNFKNNIYYKSNTNIFRDIINDTLYNKKYLINEIIFPIIIENKSIDYKLWKIIPKNNYLNFTNINYDKDKIPIVMAGGLWSNIETWKELSLELANKGYEVYLIELSGGENLECNSCYDYSYEDLEEIVFPKYIEKILVLSNSSKIKYVGHSNGARVALDSIGNGKVSSNIIETLVLVGIPGSFEKLSYFASILNNSGDIAINRLVEKNISHLSFGRISHELESITGELILPFVELFDDKNKISRNLFKKYYFWINNQNDSQPGKNLNVNYFTLIYGDAIGFDENDIIVSVIDEEEIYNNINSNNKKLIETIHLHLGMSNKKKIKRNVEKSLSKDLYK